MNRNANYFLVLLTFVALGFLTSCGDDDGGTLVGPAIEIEGADNDGGSFEGNVGETLDLTVNISSDIGFNRLQVTKEVGTDGPVTIKDTARAVGGDPITEISIPFQYILQQNEVDENVVLNFNATDNDGNTNTERFTVITNGLPANRYTVVILAAPLEDRTAESFFSSETGATYSAAEVTNSDENISQLIDFGYYYLSESGTANLASPASFPESVYNLGPNGMQWSTLNNTLLRKTAITPQQFVEYSEENVDDIFAAFDNAPVGTNPERALDISQYDVIAFETDAGQGEDPKRGLMIVEELEEGDGEEGYIELEILVTQ